MTMTAMRGRLAAAAVAMMLCAGAARAQPLPVPCAGADKECLRRASQAHEVRKLTFWQAGLARPVAERLAPAPPQLVQYLLLDNLGHDFPERPRSAVLEEDFLADVRAAMADMPEPVRRLLERKLVGIFFVDELGGSGFTDVIRDGDGEGVAGIIVLDAGVLRQRTANEWATWKENTPFKPDGRWRLQARIEDDAGDTRRNAIAYILLHELGHVLSIGSDVHPSWNLDPNEVPPAAVFPFFDLSWRNDRARNRYFSRFDLTIPRREDIAYYFGARLAAADMAPLYASLEQTNFPSLYATTRPGDDFAESFASYVHVVLQRRPWQVTITRDGAVARTFTACWDEPRCAPKRLLLEQVLQLR